MFNFLTMLLRYDYIMSGRKSGKRKAKRALMMAALASCGLRAGKVRATPTNSPRVVQTASGCVGKSAQLSASEIAPPELDSYLTTAESLGSKEFRALAEGIINRDAKQIADSMQNFAEYFYGCRDFGDYRDSRSSKMLGFVSLLTEMLNTLPEGSRTDLCVGLVQQAWECRHFAVFATNEKIFLKRINSRILGIYCTEYCRK